MSTIVQKVRPPHSFQPQEPYILGFCDRYKFMHGVDPRDRMNLGQSNLDSKVRQAPKENAPPKISSSNRNKIEVSTVLVMTPLVIIFSSLIVNLLTNAQARIEKLFK